MYVPWPSSLKVNSRFSLSFSFFPRRLFFPPYFFANRVSLDQGSGGVKCFQEVEKKTSATVSSYLSLILRHICS